MGVSGNVKSFLGRVKLFKINKIFENTLSLRVAGNGTAHSSQYFANSFKICFADRNLLTLESLSRGLCSKCTDLIEKSRTCLLRTNRTCSISAHPVFSQAFVNFSQFNLDFHEFRNLHNLNSSFAHRPSIPTLNDSRKLCIYSDFQFIFTRYWILMSFS